MKKLGFVILAIIVVAGVYCWWNNRSGDVASSGRNLPPPRNVTPIALTGTPQEQEVQIRQFTSLAKADMRTMATALEGFYIDNNAYPTQLGLLTTPIAYITQIPQDPFTVGDAFGYFKIGDADWRLWSIGPDLKDEGGGVNYDPVNGTKSDGDIVRVKS